MKKSLILCLHVAAVLMVTAAVSMLWSDALGEKGIAWIHAGKYEDSPQFARDFNVDIENVRRYTVLADAFEMAEAINPDAVAVTVENSGSVEEITIQEMIDTAAGFGCTMNPETYEVTIVDTGPSRENDVSVRVLKKMYDPWYTEKLEPGPSQGVESLAELSIEVVRAVSECYQLKEAYVDTRGNFRYYVCQPGVHGEYVMVYNDNMDSICSGKYGKYACYRHEDGSFQTNMDPAPTGMEFRPSELYEDIPAEEFSMAAAVDTVYPYHDKYFEASKAFAGKVRDAYKWIGIGLFAFAAFTITLVLILNEASAEDPADEKASARHLMDKIPMEMAIVVCAILAVIFYYLFKATLCVPMEALMPLTTQQYWRTVMKVLITYGLIVILLRSAIRRYRKGTLYSDSLFCRMELAIEEYMESGKLSATVFFKFILFVLLNLGGPLLAAWLFMRSTNGGDSRLVLVSSVILTVIVVVDALVYNRLFRDARQRDQIRDVLEQISGGDTEAVLPEKSFDGKNLETVKSINHISTGLSAAVRDQVKSERLKADLITNVSHDIKTPLTSIINYVGLLKRENIQNEKAAEYIDILDKKSQRLKNLTEDLVEASKASSGNIRIEPAKIDLQELTEQAAAEFEYKFRARGLEFIFDAPSEPVYVKADGRHLWRVFDNLLNNAAKYSMENTRIYGSVSREGEGEDARGVFTLKNISEMKLNISPEELTERFVRGDISRTTEGSGLGLSIAKSLTGLMNGELKIEIDGDLYKASVILPLYREDDTAPETEETDEKEE
ncbi:MAG: HAMP domain-containing sensor histidine kinase [Eubacteriales bacterium]|nr:HAMP domain-containing sensor histidine kinase [Eubacteriales bacterium]